MDCTSSKELINTMNFVFENKSEQPIESEFSLAEYYDEIMQILKCVPDIRVMSKQVMSNKVIVDGYVNFKIMYISQENKNVNCYEYNMPFNKTIELNNEYINHVVDLDLKIDYLNCRPINQRRIDLRGNILFTVKTFFINDSEISKRFEDDTIQQKECEVIYNPTFVLKEKSFTLNEMLNVVCEDVSELVILRSAIEVNITDYKCIMNKIIVKGEISLKMIYLENKYESEFKEHLQTIPLSQILDVNGIDENCDALISSKILSCVFDRTVNEDETSLFINIYGSLISKGYTTRSFNYISDLYSTKYEVEFSKKTSEVDIINTRKDLKISHNISLENFVSSNCRVLDFSVTCVNSQLNIVDGNLNINSDWDISCFYKDENGDICFNNKLKSINFVCEKWDNVDLDSSQCILNKVDFKYTINDKNVELKIETSNNLHIVIKKEIEFLDKLIIDQETEKQNMQDSSLTIYYGDKEEKIWDIAKKYNTCVDQILKQNNIESESLKERTMLLIPIVR